MTISGLDPYLSQDVLAQRTQDKSWKTLKIEEAATEFESQFLSLMIENMFTGIDGEGMFGGGNSETIYRSFMADEYANSIAENGGIGIADSVRAQLLKLQELEAGSSDA